MSERKLNERFEQFVIKLGTGRADLAPGWFGVLEALYSEPHRRYHSLRHIANLLERLDQLVPYSSRGLDRLLEAETAIWFHDAIYVVGSKTNEEASALLARAFLFSVGATDDGPTTGNRVGAFPDAVNEAIMATKHDGRQLNGNGARVMVDLDLAGLADPWEDFDENNQRIREEYAAVPEDVYRTHRAAFLANLLTRPIFHVLTQLEAPARANINRHLLDLLLSPSGTKESPGKL